tara:strand:+ start:603 stop:1139 length:537 start_codon:yes stop_codon:yes gene_type:complete
MAISDLPTHLTDSEKRRVFATNSGWAVQPGGNDNPDAQLEVLTAIPQLAATLGPAVVKSINWKPGSGNYTQAAGGTIGIEVVFSEEVTGFENATLEVTNDTDPARNLNLPFFVGDKNIVAFEATFDANGNVILTGDILRLPNGTVISPGGDTVLGFIFDPADLSLGILPETLPPITIG